MLLKIAGREATPKPSRPAFLRVASPFFPGILLSRKPPKTLRKWLVFEKNDGRKEWGINP